MFSGPWPRVITKILLRKHPGLWSITTSFNFVFSLNFRENMNFCISPLPVHLNWIHTNLQRYEQFNTMLIYRGRVSTSILYKKQIPVRYGYETTVMIYYSTQEECIQYMYSRVGRYPVRYGYETTVSTPGIVILQ